MTDILLETGTNELEILEFVVGEQHKFGINVAKVREVILEPKFDLVPHVHPAIVGLFKLRDKVIPLIDLHTYLSLEKVSKDPKVIVTEFNQQNFGFLVDDVTTIRRMSWTKVKSPQQLMSNSKNFCVTALVDIQDYTLLLLDFEKIVLDINPESSQKTIKETHEGKGYRVLLVDDSATLTEMASSLIGKAGFDIVTALNGQIAWDLLQKDNAFDIIVSDIEMPQMDGHTLCKKIKDDMQLKRIPVILYSSLIYTELRKKGEAGKGFAVVADEVRKLAEDSKKATGKIAELISTIQSEIGSAVQVMKTTNDEVNKGTTVVKEAVGAFEKIPTFVDKVDSVLIDISSIAEENAAGSQEISSSMYEISDSVKDITNAFSALDTNAKHLKETVDTFKL
ncbi:MAG: chemotaxis protein CheW [Candidatus Woesearchaeota archaeon]